MYYIATRTNYDMICKHQIKTQGLYTLNLTQVYTHYTKEFNLCRCCERSLAAFYIVPVNTTILHTNRLLPHLCEMSTVGARGVGSAVTALCPEYPSLDSPQRDCCCCEYPSPGPVPEPRRQVIPSRPRSAWFGCG